MISYFHLLLTNPKAARKFFVALLGAVVVLASKGLLPDAIDAWVTGIVPVLTALGVYGVQNGDTYE